LKYKVVFFTRTGISKRVAEKISDRLSCEAVQITDNMNWKGFWGFFKAGFYSSTNRNVKIDIPANLLEGVDDFIVIAPLWAGGLAPAIRALLSTLPKEKVHLVVTSDGSNLKNRLGYKSVYDIAKNSNDEDSVIDRLINNLTAARS
jgi:hypothetical protein